MGNEILQIELEDWDPEEDSDDSLETKFLIFSLDDKDYGVSIHYVTEIIGIQKISSIPEVPNYVRGVIALRNRIIPVLDMRKRLEMAEKPDGERACIVILQIRDTPLGILVESVREVITISEDKKEKAPLFGEDPMDRFISSLAKVGDRVKILIDVEKLFREEELLQIQKLTQTKKE